MSSGPDPFLVVGIVILMILMLIINTYLLIHWQHPEDKNESVLARVLILFGFQLSSVSVLMLPIDVANDAGNPKCDSSSPLSIGSSDYCGGINMFYLWDCMFGMIYFTVIVLIPFATFYYESESVDVMDPTLKKSRLWPSIIQESVVVAFFLAILLALYFTNQGTTHIPVAGQSFSISDVSSVQYDISQSSLADGSFIQELTAVLKSAPLSKGSSTKDTISYPVSFPVYLIALFGWIGWWIFAVFAGVGLTSLPFDFICEYIWRPRVLAPDEIANTEIELQERTRDILEVAQLLKRERSSSLLTRAEMRKRMISDRMEVNRLAQMAFFLERDVDEFMACKSLNQRYNPLIPYAKLGCGIFFAAISLLWQLQIILAVLTQPAVSPLLSSYLLSFDSFFPMFGNISYALLSLYLLVCTIKGCFKLSMRFICCKLHPMQLGGTYINSFLYNMGVVLLCTVPLIHFCVTALSGYSSDTDIFFMLGVQVQYMHFFSLFYANHFFIWMMLLVSLVLLPLLFFQPRDKPKEASEFKRHLYSKRGGGGPSSSAGGQKGGGFRIAGYNLIPGSGAAVTDRIKAPHS
eukprot:gene35013-45323_t